MHWLTIKIHIFPHLVCPFLKRLILYLPLLHHHTNRINFNRPEAKSPPGGNDFDLSNSHTLRMVLDQDEQMHAGKTRRLTNSFTRYLQHFTNFIFTLFQIRNPLSNS